ncbi:plastid division protein PDV1 [Tanacetum coccineum]
MKWSSMEMETEVEVEAVLEKIWDLHDKLSDAIHSISRSHFVKALTCNNNNNKKLSSSDDVKGGFVYVKDYPESESAIHEAKSLNSIRTALENLEDQLEFFHMKSYYNALAFINDASLRFHASVGATLLLPGQWLWMPTVYHKCPVVAQDAGDYMSQWTGIGSGLVALFFVLTDTLVIFFTTVQTQQRAEKDAAIARLEQSRIVLALRLADHHGKKYKVIEEARAFVGEVQNHGKFVPPENGYTSAESYNGRKSSNILVKVVISSFNFAKKSLKVDHLGSVLGNAALFTVSMLALLHLHQVNDRDRYISDLQQIHEVNNRLNKNVTKVYVPEGGSTNGLDVIHGSTLLELVAHVTCMKCFWQGNSRLMIYGSTEVQMNVKQENPNLRPELRQLIVVGAVKEAVRSLAMSQGRMGCNNYRKLNVKTGEV